MQHKKYAKTAKSERWTNVKRCPMHLDECAKRVAEQIADFYPMIRGACDCGARARYIERLTEPVCDTIEYGIDPDQEHTSECASNVATPFDAAVLIEEKCGRFTRGAHAGKLRGWAEIEVAVEGGWKKYGPGERNGRVVRPGTVLSIRIIDYNRRPYLEVTR